jgi:hypothetical protein
MQLSFAARPHGDSPDSSDWPESTLLLFILNSNGLSPGGSGTTVKHNTQTTHITQNNTTIKRNTVHKTTHTINTLHRMKIQQSQLHTRLRCVENSFYVPVHIELLWFVLI